MELSEAFKEMRKVLNRTHPEMRSDEVLLCNTYGNAGSDYATVRYGKQSYDFEGIPLEGCRPVFVGIKEYVNRKHDIINGMEIET